MVSLLLRLAGRAHFLSEIARVEDVGLLAGRVTLLPFLVWLLAGVAAFVAEYVLGYFAHFLFNTEYWLVGVGRGGWVDGDAYWY